MLGLFVLAFVIFVLPFAFPTPPPIITRFQSTTLFSPNGDGSRDVAVVTLRVREPSDVQLDVVHQGTVVRTLIDGEHLAPGRHRRVWDGTDDRGAPLADGTYGLRLRAAGPGGKRFRVSRAITIDTAPPRPAAFRVVSATLASPGASQCRISFSSHDAGTVLFEVLRPGGTRPLAHRGPRPVAANGTVRWRWSGRADSGRHLEPGTYRVRATLRDAGRNVTTRERTCWVGRLTGTITPADPRPRQTVAVALRRTVGIPLAPSTPVTLELRRRTGIPGATATPPLGARVGPLVRTTAGRARIALPAGISPAALWLVARHDGPPAAAALIPLRSRP